MKGQILVTERTEHVLPTLIATIRQTVKGSLMLGDSQKDVGLDTNQKPTVMQTIARRGVVLSFPQLRDLLVPGACTANCHSDVTIAAAHANLLAPMIAEGAFDPALDLFSAKLFDVPATA